MPVLVSDLVRDVQITIDFEREASAYRKEAEKRLLDGLALIGKPLLEKCFVVIGDVMVKRPYSTLPLEVSKVTTVPVDSVVVNDEPSLNPHSDLP